jgi:hypothetical protein
VEIDAGGVGANAVGIGIGENSARTMVVGRTASVLTAITETPQCIGPAQSRGGVVSPTTGPAACRP